MFAGEPKLAVLVPKACLMNNRKMALRLDPLTPWVLDLDRQ